MERPGCVLPPSVSPWKVVLLVSSAVFMVRLDSYIVNISLPAMARDFGVGTNEISWVILAYLLIMTGSLLLFGKLGDRIGLRRIFLVGYGIFTAASVFCGLAPSLGAINLARALQGVGGAMMVTGAFALLPRHISPDRLGWAFGWAAIANSLGIMVGAPLGGFISGWYSWKGIFLINLPVGLLALLLTRRILPPDPPPGEGCAAGPFDYAGAGWSFVLLTGLVYLLSEWHVTGARLPGMFLSIAITAAALVFFVQAERRAADPLLPLSLLRRGGLLPACVTALFALMLLAGSNFLLPFYLELIQGLRPETAGLVLLTYSLVYLPLGPVSGRLSDRMDSRCVTAAGMFVAAVGGIVFIRHLGEPGLAAPLAYLVFLGVGFGLFFAASNHYVMSLATPDSRGAVSGLLSTVMNLGMIFGVCLFEGLFAAMLPTGVSRSDLAQMRGDLSLGEAFSVAYGAGVVLALSAVATSLLSRKKAASCSFSGPPCDKKISL